MTTEVNYITKELTDDQVLEVHKMATAAMPFMNFLFALMEQQSRAKFNSAPVDHVKSLLFIKAVDAATKEMQQNVRGVINHGERVLAEMAQRNSPEYKEKKRIDELGFGLNRDRGAAS